MTPAQATTLDQSASPLESAHSAGLRYVTDQMPGIRRERSGGGFRYRYPTGEYVSEEEVLQRIHALAIPPAWEEVWICPDPCGHVQATGRDQRRRKQSRYHPRWRETRDETKYARLVFFARALRGIRRRVNADLALPGLPRNKVLATVVRLLELSHIRIGNEEYARENESFGLTTFRNRHVKVRGATLRFHFRGKSGKWHDVAIEDRRLARVVHHCQDLPGQELFQYVDDTGERRAVNSEDVNDYLREISGKDFTAKDFRTWSGTVLAAAALRATAAFRSQRQAKRNIVRAIEAVAERLGNTVAVCRKCYIHPEVLEAYLDRTRWKQFVSAGQANPGRPRRGLRSEEMAVLDLLRKKASPAPQARDHPFHGALDFARMAG